MSVLTGFDWWLRFRGTAQDGKAVQILYDYAGAPDVSNPKYIGAARSGFAETDSAWRITRFDYDGNDQVEAQFESNPNVKWSERASTPYNQKQP